MSSTPAPTPRSMPEVIAEKLRALRGALWRWLLVAGMSRWLVWVVALLAIDFVIDYLRHMDSSERLLLLLVMAAALLVVFIRRVAMPLRSEMNDDALCGRVEAAHRELGQSVITAMQLSRVKDPESVGVSPALVDAAIAHGAEAARGVDFTTVLDRRRFNKQLTVLLVALVLLIGAGVGAAVNETMAIWFNRNILLGDRAWPQDTYLAVAGAKDGRVTIPRGDDWTAAAVVEKGDVPTIVEIEYEPLESSIFSRSHVAQMKQIGDRAFEAPFKNVIEPFRFRVRGGDDRGTWITTELVDRPSVAKLELTLHPPTYTRLGDQPLPAGRSPYDALTGSGMTVVGYASKPLKHASLRIAGGPEIPCDVSNQPTVLGEDDERGWRFAATVPAAQLVAGAYAIELTSTDELAAKPPTRFAVRMKRDADPAVKASLVGIGSLVVPGARVPIDFDISDDFAITDARLVYQARLDAPDADSAANEEKAVRFDALADQFATPTRHIADQHVLELPPLNLPVGTTLGFRVEAVDNDAITGPKTGSSRMFYVTVVDERTLRDELLRREQEQRQEFARLLKDQEDLWVETRALHASIAGKSPTPNEAYQALTRAQKRQRLVADRTRVIVRQFEQIKAELLNNRIEEPNGPAESRLQRQIINPLDAMARDLVPSAADAMDDARRLSDDAAERDKALVAAAEAQAKVLAVMREALKHMVKWEGYQEALNLAYEVAGAQERVNQAVLKEMQRRIREIFGDDTPPGTPPGTPPTPAPAPTPPDAPKAPDATPDKPK